MTTTPHRPLSTTLPATTPLATVQDLFPAIVAGLVAVLISYAGPLLLVLQAAHAGQLSAAQLTS